MEMLQKIRIKIWIHTLTAEQGGEVPQLSHVECLEHLTLVGSTVTVQDDASVGLLVVLLGESQTGTNGHLGTDDTVATVEVLREHVHGATLAVGNTLPAAQQLTDDRPNRTTAHHSETVAAISSDDLVLAVDSVLNTNSNSLLAGGQVAETTNLLLLVQAIGSHLHATHGDHVAVHLLQLILGGLQGVRRRVELVGLEALVGETNGERLVIILYKMTTAISIWSVAPCPIFAGLPDGGLNKPAGCPRRAQTRRQW